MSRKEQRVFQMDVIGITMRENPICDTGWYVIPLKLPRVRMKV